MCSSLQKKELNILSQTQIKYILGEKTLTLPLKQQNMSGHVTASGKTSETTHETVLKSLKICLLFLDFYLIFFSSIVVQFYSELLHL